MTTVSNNWHQLEICYNSVQATEMSYLLYRHNPETALFKIINIEERGGDKVDRTERCGHPQRPCTRTSQGQGFLRTQAAEAQGGAARLVFHANEWLVACRRGPASHKLPACEIFMWNAQHSFWPKVDTQSFTLHGGLISFSID